MAERESTTVSQPSLEEVLCDAVGKYERARALMEKEQEPEQGTIAILLLDAELKLHPIAHAHPMNPEIAHLLGKVLFERRHFGAALIELNRARENMAAENEENILYRGLALLCNDNPGAAAATLRKAYAARKSPNIARYLGEVYVTLGEYARAKELLSLSLTANPYDAAGHALLGETYFCLGLYKAAITYLKPALSIFKDDAFLHSILGISLFHVRDQEHAEVHLQRAAELEPGPRADCQLSFFYLNTGRYHEARTSVNKARQAAPHDEDVLEQWRAVNRVVALTSRFRPEEESKRFKKRRGKRF